MEWVIVVILVVVAIAVATFRSRKDGQAGTGALRVGEVLPYERNELLLSAAELSLFGVLRSALDMDYRVFPKVRVADAISVRGPLPKAEWQRAFNRISSKHFDFVICRASDMRIMWAIKLDDRSHQQPSRIERDKFLEAVCSSAALPLMRVPAKAAYSVAELRNQLTTYARREDDFQPSSISAQQLVVCYSDSFRLCSWVHSPLKGGSHAQAICRAIE